jgi:hypothetical protein
VKLVEHLVEPKRLTLAWQSLNPEHGRRRYAVGELTVSEFRYLMGSEDFEAARKLGFAGYPAFRLSAPIHTRSVLDPFLRRIPPRTRTDFPKFMHAIGLDPNRHVSDLALLAYSEARDISDGFSLVNRFEGVEAPLEFVTEVAGYRYENRSDAVVNVDEEVRFSREPGNTFDPDAIRIETAAGLTLGYVNRLQNSALARWMSTGVVRGWVARKNGRPAHPRLYIFVKVDAAMTAAA